uniref:Protein Lines C-terminal domain-containing protein n=1 Tax=Vitis vinifera TaxID=29760 RepID=F6HRY6_VITVI
MSENMNKASTTKDTRRKEIKWLVREKKGVRNLIVCLRKICESWDLFVEFSVTGKFMSQSFRKKRKVFQNGPDSQVEPSSSPIIDVGIPMSLEKECMRKHNYGHKERGSREQPFKEAKECLLSLKNSVENLHQKSLFPYNPQVLLRRSVSIFHYYSKFHFVPCNCFLFLL